MTWAAVDTPIGPLAVAADETAVYGIRFAAEAPAGEPPAGAVVLRAAIDELRGYFAGDVTAFTVPVRVDRGSTFERAVWAELARIPYGEMRTYGQVAAEVGDPGAARAVGVACNRNPVPVLVPCHRVVGAGGKLVGFGGGLVRKRQLLELEAGVSVRRAWG